MISLSPADRLSAKEYLMKWEGSAFPNYFDSFLHYYVNNLTKATKQSTNDDRIRHLESDNRIEDIWKNYGKIVSALGIMYEDTEKQLDARSMPSVVPVCLDLPGISHWVPKLKGAAPTDDDGALIIISVLCSSIRSTLRSSSKIKGCDLLLALGERIHDEAKLDRCLPYLFTLLDDSSDNVQVAALRSITHLLDLVGTISPVNGKIFPEYILPRLSMLLSRASDFVREAYASCLSSLARSAARFLDMGQVLKSTGMLETEDPETENGILTDTAAYDTLKQSLSVTLEEHVIALLTDSNSSVRRALIKTITPLCIFFGKQKTNDIILSHLITYLNDRDPFLRVDFFDTIIGLAPFVGVVSVEEYIIPLMIQALTDPEEFVVVKVIQAFNSLSELGILRMPCLWDSLKICAKFMIHPNTWIRNSTLLFISTSIRWMSLSQLYCILLPILLPYLECEINNFSYSNLIRTVKPPLSRVIYDRTVTWASKAQKSLFWKVELGTKSSDSIQKIKKSSIIISKSSEDEQWLLRLKEAGLRSQDMWKLLAFRDHIFKVARLNYQLATPSDDSQLSTFVRVQSIGVFPRNIFFDGVNENGNGSANENDNSREYHEHFEVGEAKIKSGAYIPGRKEHGLEPILSSKSSLNGTVRQQLEPTKLLGAQSDRNNSISRVKALPLTGTDLTDAYGELGQDLPSNVSHMNKVSQDFSSGKGQSSYSGDDPYILRLLESVYLDSVYEEQTPEFGPYVPSVNREYNGSSNTSKMRRARGLGVLVSSFEEHKGAITSLAVSPDHNFFITGSEDGTVKIWDCYRLEKNVINMPVQTLTFEDGIKVTGLCFLENSYTFTCATSDGVLSLVRIDAYFNIPNSAPKYRKMVFLRSYKLGNEARVTDMVHAKTDITSQLYILSSDSRIVVVDVKTMTCAAVMQNPSKHGPLTTMVIDRNKNWLLVGTTQGILDLWDLRFQVLVRSWGLAGGTPIRKLSLYPRASGRWVCVAGGTLVPEITVWDIVTGQCKEIFRVSRNDENIDKSYEATNPDESDLSSQTYTVSQLLRESSNSEILSLITGVESDQENGRGKKGFMITGGTDKILRYWDLHSTESSSIISGLKHDSGRPLYTESRLTPNDIRVVTERISLIQQQTKTGRSKNERLTRTTAISADHQDLGRNHSMAITQLALLKKPFDMIISVDRGGSIKVYI